MAYHPAVKGIWTFNKVTIDEVQNMDFASPARFNLSYKMFQKYDFLEDGIVPVYGLEFESGKPLSAGSALSFAVPKYSFSIGFWWYSATTLGQAPHIITKQMTPRMAPILAKSVMAPTGFP